MLVRQYRAEDNSSIVKLFYDTVHTVNARDYSPGQLNAWAPDNIDIARWCKAFESDFTLVAEQNHVIIGFANISKAGYFDRLYIHKDYQGIGAAKKLADAIETHARESQLAEIRVDASITAKPFFLKRGYKVLNKNVTERCGQQLVNYTMAKCLQHGGSL